MLNPGAVAIDGADIVGVDTRPTRSPRSSRARTTIDAAGQVVMPGLINTHTHAAMVMYRGLGDDLNLMDWLQKYIFPAEAKTVSPEFVRIGTQSGRARDDPVGHDDLRRHVLLRGGNREGRPRRPACAASSDRR